MADTVIGRISYLNLVKQKQISVWLEQQFGIAFTVHLGIFFHGDALGICKFVAVRAGIKDLDLIGVLGFFGSNRNWLIL